MLDEKAIVNVKESFEHLAKAFTEVFIRLADRLMEIGEDLKEIVIENFEYENERKMRRQHYKLNFSRPKIQHQVLDRKPRNLIKKII